MIQTTNIAIQLFSYDLTPRVLQLLRVLEVFGNDARKLRIVWYEHDGARRTIALGALLNANEDSLKLNNFYMQTPASRLRSELTAIGVHEWDVCFELSPNSVIWAGSQTPTSNGKPGIRRIVSGVQGLEQCAVYRKTNIMPSVVEVTLRCTPFDVECLSKPICDSVCRAWPLIECAEKFGTIDFGAEWLFFPKSGYNPNISAVHVYYNTEPRDAWPKVRERHNVTFESNAKDSTVEGLQMIVHSLEPRKREFEGKPSE